MLLQNYKIELCTNTRFVDLQQSLSIICLGTMIWVGLGENVRLTPSKPSGTVAREREVMMMVITFTMPTCLKAPGRMVLSPVLAREREVRWGRAGKSPGPKEGTDEEER